MALHKTLSFIRRAYYLIRRAYYLSFIRRAYYLLHRPIPTTRTTYCIRPHLGKSWDD